MSDKTWTPEDVESFKESPFYNLIMEALGTQKIIYTNSLREREADRDHDMYHKGCLDVVCLFLWV